MNDARSDLDPVAQLAESFLARYRRGERPSLTEYTENYPELAEQIRELFPGLVVLEELGSVSGWADATRTTTATAMPQQLGEYRILREVGRGGMGIVYEAVQESLGRHVALKVLPTHGLMNPVQLERFRREARAAARLHHTNIVPVFGVGEHQGTHFYAMQFIQGQGLDEVLKELRRLREQTVRNQESGVRNQRSIEVKQEELAATPTRDSRQPVAGQKPGPGAPGPGFLPHDSCLASRDFSLAAPGAEGLRTEFVSQSQGQYFRTVAQIAVQVADALDYAHREGILHRDIKPSNLLLDLQGRVWVSDFGLAKSEGTDELTHTGDIVGTLRYMAPERFNGWADPRSDVYSLGITLYELLTLRPAFYNSNRGRLIKQVTHDEPCPPRKLDRSIPRDLETIVLKAIAKEPAQRYPTADAMAQDLRRFLTDRPIEARRSSVYERGVRWCRRNPAVAALTTLVAALLLAAAAGGSVAALHFIRMAEQARGEQQKAKESEAEAQDVLKFFQEKVLAAGRPEGQEGGLGKDVTLRQVIDAAEPEIATTFKGRPLVEAAIRDVLGMTYYYLGEHAAAIRQREVALELYRTKLGHDHPDTLSSMDNLANIYHALGRYEESRQLSQETLLLRKGKLGSDHPDTLRSMNSLGDSYYGLGRHAETLKLYDETLRLRKAKLGADHPDTLRSMNNLASIYHTLGRNAEALKLNEETLWLRKATLGPDHPHTLTSMANLANSYDALGQRAEALKLLEETLRLRKAKLGVDHPHTLMSMAGLANSYQVVGRHAEALKLREETLRLRKAKLGPSHPATLRSMHSLADSYRALGRDDEALALIDDCLKAVADKAADWPLIPSVMKLRLQIFQKKGDSAGCLESTARWEALRRPDAASLYQAACFRAVCAAVMKEANPTAANGPDLASEQADMAMTWLAQAIAAGYKDLEHIRKNADLDPLRAREDFKNLLAELERSAAHRRP